jgi:hypothetical protein
LLGARIAKQLFAKNDVMVVPVVIAGATEVGDVALPCVGQPPFSWCLIV